MEIISTESRWQALATFLEMLTSLESVRLGDVDSNVLEAVAQTGVDMYGEGRSSVGAGSWMDVGGNDSKFCEGSYTKEKERW